ncbi:SubName: Full=Uncharacterized protein {ECO:0000313/EMBL:CCA71424.1} [Serendipita indica DSM 11827]|uniref:Uncharacterized protein n=1 Tax=Serendipita indica (strain DSM 11827) TaxID=1109443 RepID=G4TJD1_SERID|nr:SubName: Full=Uncharacterized protein {ECO:0000313/EMBL:CCA71424.1} [Serendipita indica DSM 11827]CCA71424.1 hypothetical protein PIIN_05363 [Serendipita indica DSM 11827]
MHASTSTRNYCRPLSPLALSKALHLASIPTLVLLSMANLHSESPSTILVGSCLCVAATSIVFNRASISTASPNTAPEQTPRRLSTSRLNLAISLLRASLYAFIADGTVALLLVNAPEDPSHPFGFGFDEWAQVGLAGVMWLLGAALWIIEPITFWLDSRSMSKGARREALLRGDYEQVPSYDPEDTIIVWEEDPEHPSFVQFVDKE